MADVKPLSDVETRAPFLRDSPGLRSAIDILRTEIRRLNDVISRCDEEIAGYVSDLVDLHADFLEAMGLLRTQRNLTHVVDACDCPTCAFLERFRTKEDSRG